MIWKPFIFIIIFVLLALPNFSLAEQQRKLALAPAMKGTCVILGASQGVPTSKLAEIPNITSDDCRGEAEKQVYVAQVCHEKGKSYRLSSNFRPVAGMASLSPGLAGDCR